MNRRQFVSSLAAAAFVLPGVGQAKSKQDYGPFRFCLNTSTIMGKKLGIEKYVEIAAQAGYDGIEVWVRDLKKYLEAGNSAASLKKSIQQKGLTVESAIGFAPWLRDDKGFQQMKQEMEMLASIGCKRIAAPAAGVSADQPLDLLKAGEKYAELLELGRQIGVMPQLEFWGASKVLWHLGQVLAIAAAANDPDVLILPDVYHMFRGNSGFHALKMLDGQLIEMFHINDYPGDIPRTEQKDADRVYPGDGVAPLTQILTDLKNMGGEKVLSLELFNRTYWQQDPLDVAVTGLQKMKGAVTRVV